MSCARSVAKWKENHCSFYSVRDVWRYESGHWWTKHLDWICVCIQMEPVSKPVWPRAFCFPITWENFIWEFYRCEEKSFGGQMRRGCVWSEILCGIGKVSVPGAQLLFYQECLIEVSTVLAAELAGKARFHQSCGDFLMSLTVLSHFPEGRKLSKQNILALK